MRPTRVLFLVALIWPGITACRKPDGGLGLGLQPEGELLDLRTDTLPFSLEMVHVDSDRTMNGAACFSAPPLTPSVD